MLSFKNYLAEAATSSFSGVLYHGSGYSFDDFDQKKARVADDFYGGGLAYLTSDTKVAITYAKSLWLKPRKQERLSSIKYLVSSRKYSM